MPAPAGMVWIIQLVARGWFAASAGARMDPDLQSGGAGNHELSVVAMLPLEEDIQYRLVGPSASAYPAAEAIKPGLEDGLSSRPVLSEWVRGAPTA